jgi:hypothetical protein
MADIDLATGKVRKLANAIAEHKPVFLRSHNPAPIHIGRSKI